ncbi:hypothetical protein HY477_00660 [Candidatus Uhrbacteria bacterium]|nr:hypothetical protein [Candidatus Uhrbacteria bacterium]
MSKEGPRQPPPEAVQEQAPETHAETERAFFRIAQAGALLLNRTGNYEDYARLVAEAKKFLPQEWVPDYQEDNPDSLNRAVESMLARIFDAVRSSNLGTLNLDVNPSRNGFVMREGVFEQGKGWQLQFEDRKGFSKSGANLAWVNTTVRKLVADARYSESDSFKAHVTIAPTGVFMVMDPGTHKEFLGLVSQAERGTSGLLAYSHVFSPHERGQKKEAQYRRKYIEQILAKYGLRLQRDETTVNGLLSSSNVAEDFRELARLALSVKDLDLGLHSDREVDFAARAFQSGAMNMRWFLSKCRQIRDGQLKPTQSRELAETTLLNPDEHQLLEQYRKYRIRVEAAKKQYRDKIEDIRQVKDLNYEILQGLLDLQEQGKQALAGGGGHPKKPELIGTKFEALVKKLARMESLVNRVIPRAAEARLRTHSEEIAEEFWPDVLAMEELQKGGDIPNRALTQTRFAKMFEDAGGGLEDWSAVKTLEEAVRFLHGQLYQELKNGFGAGSRKEWEKDEALADEYDDASGLALLDVSERGLEQSETYQIFQATLKRLAPFQLENMGKADASGDVPFLAFGDDFAELTFPQGKHKIEVAAQTRAGKHAEYGVTFRYFESGYFGAQKRTQYLKGALQWLGIAFKPSEENERLLIASTHTKDKEKWERQFSEVIRLTYSLSDLDLAPAIARQAARLFKAGITDIRHAGFGIIRIEQADIDSKDFKDVVKRVFLPGEFRFGQDERKYAAEVILDKAKNINALKKALLELSAGELDLFISAVFDLEDKVNEGGDKNKQKQLKRVANSLVKFFDKQFPAGNPAR